MGTGQELQVTGESFLACLSLLCCQEQPSSQGRAFWSFRDCGRQLLGASWRKLDISSKVLSFVASHPPCARHLCLLSKMYSPKGHYSLLQFKAAFHTGAKISSSAKLSKNESYGLQNAPFQNLPYWLFSQIVQPPLRLLPSQNAFVQKENAWQHQQQQQTTNQAPRFCPRPSHPIPWWAKRLPGLAILSAAALPFPSGTFICCLPCSELPPPFPSFL